MNFVTKSFFTVPFLCVIGCAGPDLVMPNPVVTGQLAQNRIVKPHGFAESRSGLPVGSMSDDVVIESLDKQQICVAVSLHELSAIDMTTAEIKFESDTGSILQPQLNAEPPTSQTYQGLVAHTEQTGTRLVCNYNNGQSVCETQPVYATTMIPGPVEVYNTKGRMCAPNQNLVTPVTKELALKITTPTAEPGAWGIGHGHKTTKFRWAFQ